MLPGEEAVAREQARVLDARPQDMDKRGRARDYARLAFCLTFRYL